MELHCDPDDARDWFRGDQWDHVAFDPDSRLVLEVVVGKRLDTTAFVLLEGLSKRLGGRPPELVSSDGYAVYEEALLSHLRPGCDAAAYRQAGPTGRATPGAAWGDVVRPADQAQEEGPPGARGGRGGVRAIDP